MATPRERLQSIMATCAKLQEKTDAELEKVGLDLAEVDDVLHESFGFMEED